MVTQSMTKKPTALFRVVFLAASAVMFFAVCFFQSMALAGTFPTKTVKIVVPYPPGGSPDQLARAIASRLSELWDSSVVVENRSGAGGSIAASYVSKATPDGHTLLLGSDGPLAINPLLYSSLDYDPFTDLEAISIAATVDFVLVASPDLGVGSLEEFLSLAQNAQPRLAYASSGLGSQHHLGMELFMRRVGLEMSHTPYRGSPPALSDVMGGHVATMFTAVPSAAAAVKGNRLTALAVTGLERTAFLPDTPTLHELGVTDFELQAWFGLSAPKGTPSDTINKIARDLGKALGRPEAQEVLASVGFTVVTGSPNEFSELIRTESTRWGKIAAAAGVQPQ